MVKKHVIFANAPTPINGGQGYFPEDIKRLYDIPSDLDGEGQTIGILEFSNGYSLNDAKKFWTMHNIESPTVTFVSVDGTRNDRGTQPDDEEASLDLQWVGAIAPKAKIVVYEANAGDTYATFADALAKTLEYILNDTTHNPSVLSISYGDAEATFGSDAVSNWGSLIEQLDAKGITVCVSSGDQGAYGMHDPNGPRVPHADAPASSPYAVAVGGTSLLQTGEETAWSYRGPENGGATGGGFSSVFMRPSFQTGVGAATRGLPDVSFNADPATGYQIIFQGQPVVVGGTSVSAPVFAAIVALANQRRQALGHPPLSRLTEILYQGEAKSSYKDITSGDNTFNGVQGYPAVTGWDASTGFGSLHVSEWILRVSESTVSTAPPVPSRGTQHKTFAHPVVHVRAVISRVESDVEAHGVYHHRLLLEQIQVLDESVGGPLNIPGQVFCAIRYGDKLGLPGPIPGLKTGYPMELKGEYIDKNHTYPSVGNPGDPVFHYVHHPVGFVIYEGRMYE